MPRHIYNWEDTVYRNFIMELVIMLESYQSPAKTILFDELAEITEVLFIGKGSVVVGYEINKLKKYCIKYENYCVIGTYEIMFNKRSEFIYTSLSYI